MVDQAAAGLAAAGLTGAHAAAPVAAPAPAPSAAVHAVPHPAPPAAAFSTQGSFMADLMDDDPEPSAPLAAAATNAAPAHGLLSSAVAAAPTIAQPDIAAAEGGSAPVTARHEDGDAAPLTMRLSMSELLGEEDGPPTAAGPAAPMSSAQPAPVKPPDTAATQRQGPSGVSATPPAGTDGQRPSDATTVAGAGTSAGASTADAPSAAPPAVGGERALPTDPLAIQDSGYEADVEAAIADGAGRKQMLSSADVSGGDTDRQDEAHGRDDDAARTAGVAAP